MELDLPYSLRHARPGDSLPIKQLIYQVGINPMNLNWRNFIIAVDNDGSFIGCGQVKSHRDGSLELASIAVKTEWRNNGVATSIIKMLIETHTHPLYLTCRAELGKFYEQFGFRNVEKDEMPPYFRGIARLAKSLGRLKLIPGNLLVMIYND